jgi:hypothetical protein
LEHEAFQKTVAPVPMSPANTGKQNRIKSGELFNLACTSRTLFSEFYIIIPGLT